MYDTETTVTQSSPLDESKSTVAQVNQRLAAPTCAALTVASSSTPSVQYATKAILWNEVEFGTFIECGFSATVSRGKWQGREVAIKQMHKVSHGNQNLLSHFRNELEILELLCHPGMMHLYGRLVTEKDPSGEQAFVMPLMAGDLFGMIEKKQNFNPVAVLYELACVFEYLHANRTIFLDLKPENVLLDSAGHIRLADYGLAVRTTPEGKFVSNSQRILGTDGYIAPEIYQDSLIRKVNCTYTFKTDIWSFGVLAWTITSGYNWLSGYRNDPMLRLSKMIRGDKEKIPEGCDPVVASVIEACVEVDPGKRPTATLLRRKLEAALPSDFLRYSLFRPAICRQALPPEIPPVDMPARRV